MLQSRRCQLVVSFFSPSSLLIRLILIYCFNYAFLPWPLFLHVSLEIVVWSVKWKEAKPSVFVIPDLYEVVNPFQSPKIQSRFPLEFALIPSERKSLPKGFLVISWPGQCLLSWSLFGRWPRLCSQRLMLFNAFTMVDKPVEKASPLTVKTCALR